jgi:transcription antitermination factor NusB
MGSRRKARELAVQVLFHMEFCPGAPNEAFDLICENFRAGQNIRSFSRELAVGVCENVLEIDQLIRQASENWRLERMPQLDKSVLRLAVYEMLHREDIPPKVSIDEAVEMAKKYGSEESGGFVNGVLDRVYSILVETGRLRRAQSG